MRSSILAALVALSAVACSDDEMTTDAAVSIDARPSIDAPVVDAAMIDAALPDAAPPDADPPDADPPDADPPDADPPDADGSVTVILTATADATICSDGNAIGDGSIFVGISNDSVVRRGLVRFDLSSIPAGSTIAEARLNLTETLIRGAVIANAHRLTADWSEGPSVGAGSGAGQCGTPVASDATWSTTGLGGTWTAMGGDFEATASGSQAVAGAFAITGLGADVQGWLDGTNPNYGWALVATEEVALRNAARLATAPTLTVRYFAP